MTGAVNGSISRETLSEPLALFRQEALAAASGNQFGQPIAKLPVSWRLLSGVMAAMLATSAIFLSSGTYTRKETAAGLIRSTGGDLRVATPSPGIVNGIFVSDGQHVKIGQTMLLIETLRIGANGQPIDQALLQNIQNELSSLKLRLISVDQAANIEANGMPSRLAALVDEREATAQRERSASERLRITQRALARLAPVAARGFISEESMRRHEEEVLAARQSMAEATGTKARIQGQISELRNYIARQPMMVTQQRGEINEMIARIQREHDTALGQRGFVVKAPASGIVNAIQVGKGQLVDPQSTLMTVSVPHQQISAEIFVPSRAIGFLEKGQEVRIRYEAFPYQRFGVGLGHIKAISSTVLAPNQVSAPIRIDEPVYRVVVALNQNSIAAYGRRYAIRPGLALSADIILDRRTFAQWLLDPVAALRGRL